MEESTKELCFPKLIIRLFPFSFISFLSSMETMTSIIECKYALFFFVVSVLLYFPKCDEECP